MRYRVGEDSEKSIVKLYNKLMANADIIPAGVMQPLVKPRSIDDVPTLAVTLWSDGSPRTSCGASAVEAVEEVNSINDVSETTIIGGERRQVRVVLDAARLRRQRPLGAAGARRAARRERPASLRQREREPARDPGRDRELPAQRDEVGGVVAGVFQGRPVYLRDVAKIEDGPAEPSSYVLMGLGPAPRQGRRGGREPLARVPGGHDRDRQEGRDQRQHRGGDGAAARIEELRGTVIPADVELTVTRNYGETAQEKSDELLKHMLLATVSVIILVVLALGWREAVVVAVAVPVTLALTLLINYLYGYTLNRVTLFALIFSIGILVDDAIVVVENIHRHFKKIGGGSRSKLAAILAVDEVGNPTILATFTVIAALMPLALRARPDGPVHAADPGRRLGGDDLLAAGGLHRQPLARLPAAAPRRRGAGARGTPTGQTRDGALVRRRCCGRCCRAAPALVALGGVVLLLGARWR